MGSENDDILFAALRQVGLDLPEGASSVAHLDSATVVAACARCLNAINESQGEDTRFAEKLPGNAGASFRLCTRLAEAVTALGFTSELGFNNFLYPSERETRKLLLFLVDAMPKADGGGEDTALVGGGGTTEMVQQAMARWSDRLWVPPGWQQRRVLDPKAAARLRGVIKRSAAAAAAEARRQEELEAGFLSEKGDEAVGTEGSAAAFAASAQAAAAALTEAAAREAAQVQDGWLGHHAAFMHEEETGGGGGEGEAAAEPEEQAETPVQRAERLEREKLQQAHAALEEAQEARAAQRRRVEAAEAECDELEARAAQLQQDVEQGAAEVKAAQQATQVRLAAHAPPHPPDPRRHQSRPPEPRPQPEP